MDPSVAVTCIVFIPFYIFVGLLLRWFASKYNRYERLVLKSLKARRVSDSPEKIASIAAELIRDIARRR